MTQKIAVAVVHGIGNQAPEFAEKLEKSVQPSNVTAENVFSLIYRYGRDAEIIIQNATQNNQALTEAALLEAELEYCISEEAATNLSDYFIRRTGKLFFEREVVMSESNLLEDKISQWLKWSNEQKTAYHAALMNEYESAVIFN